jgi:uncharacterized protein
MADPEAVAAVRRYLGALAERGLAPSFAVLFGSAVTGGAGRWSDLDLVVVASRFDRPYTVREVGLLWRVAARVDSRIEPIPCGERQWDDDTWTPILEVARREGLRVAA